MSWLLQPLHCEQCGRAVIKLKPIAVSNVLLEIVQVREISSVATKVYMVYKVFVEQVSF